MRFKIKQKLLSISDSFTIHNESNEAAYQVKGRFFSLGDKLTFEDMEGSELALITQKMLRLSPTYEIRRHGKIAATVKKKRSLLREKFSVSLRGEDNITVKGSFVGREYTFTRSGKKIATVSRKFWALADTYGIDIDDDEDEVTLLAAIVVIDLILDGDKDD